MDESPWNIQSIYDLQYFNCPSCAYKDIMKQEFINHAYNFHPESIRFLRKINDGSINDIEIPLVKDEDDSDLKTEILDTNISGLTNALVIKTEEIEINEDFSEQKLRDYEKKSNDEEILDDFDAKIDENFEAEIEENLKIYKCSKCNKTFKNWRTLAIHLRKIHASMRIL